MLRAAIKMFLSKLLTNGEPIRVLGSGSVAHSHRRMVKLLPGGGAGHGGERVKRLAYKQLNIMRPGLLAPTRAEVFLPSGQGQHPGHRSWHLACAGPSSVHTPRLITCRYEGSY